MPVPLDRSIHRLSKIRVFTEAHLGVYRYTGTMSVPECAMLHLTPVGWISDAESRPSDGVLTIQIGESGISEIWRHADEALVRETLSRHGGALPQKSGEGCTKGSR